MRAIKLGQVGLELPRLLTTRNKFVCVGVTSCVDIDCARLSLCQAPKAQAEICQQKLLRFERKNCRTNNKLHK